jgi:ADP-ribosylglycohydrolase
MMHLRTYAGLYSDDTQQCMVLIQCCLNGSGNDAQPEEEDADQQTHEDEMSKKTRTQAVRLQWNVQRWGDALGDMLRRSALRDYGRHFKEAVTKLSHHTPPQRSGTKSMGMGAAMRIGKDAYHWHHNFF